MWQASKTISRFFRGTFAGAFWSDAAELMQGSYIGLEAGPEVLPQMPASFFVELGLVLQKNQWETTTCGIPYFNTFPHIPLNPSTFLAASLFLRHPRKRNEPRSCEVGGWAHALPAGPIHVQVLPGPSRVLLRQTKPCGFKRKKLGPACTWTCSGGVKQHGDGVGLAHSTLTPSAAVLETWRGFRTFPVPCSRLKESGICPGKLSRNLQNEVPKRRLRHTNTCFGVPCLLFTRSQKGIRKRSLLKQEGTILV